MSSYSEEVMERVGDLCSRSDYDQEAIMEKLRDLFPGQRIPTDKVVSELLSRHRSRGTANQLVLAGAAKLAEELGHDVAIQSLPGIDNLVVPATQPVVLVVDTMCHSAVDSYAPVTIAYFLSPEDYAVQPLMVLIGPINAGTMGTLVTRLRHCVTTSAPHCATVHISPDDVLQKSFEDHFSRLRLYLGPWQALRTICVRLEDSQKFDQVYRLVEVVRTGRETKSRDEALAAATKALTPAWWTRLKGAAPMSPEQARVSAVYEFKMLRMYGCASAALVPVIFGVAYFFPEPAKMERALGLWQDGNDDNCTCLQNPCVHSLRDQLQRCGEYDDFAGITVDLVEGGPRTVSHRTVVIAIGDAAPEFIVAPVTPGQDHLPLSRHDFATAVFGLLESNEQFSALLADWPLGREAYDRCKGNPAHWNSPGAMVLSLLSIMDANDPCRDTRAQSISTLVRVKIELCDGCTQYRKTVDSVTVINAQAVQLVEMQERVDVALSLADYEESCGVPGCHGSTEPNVEIIAPYPPIVIVEALTVNTALELSIGHATYRLESLLTLGATCAVLPIADGVPPGTLAHLHLYRLLPPPEPYAETFEEARRIHQLGLEQGSDQDEARKAWRKQLFKCVSGASEILALSGRPGLHIPAIYSLRAGDVVLDNIADEVRSWSRIEVDPIGRRNFQLLNLGRPNVHNFAIDHRSNVWLQLTTGRRWLGCEHMTVVAAAMESSRTVHKIVSSPLCRLAKAQSLAAYSDAQTVDFDADKIVKDMAPGELTGTVVGWMYVGSHFSAVLVESAKRVISVYDGIKISRGNRRGLEAILRRVLALNTGQDVEWVFAYPETAKQTDGWICGHVALFHMSLLCQYNLQDGAPDKHSLYPGLDSFEAEHSRGLLVSTLRAMWTVRKATQDITDVMMGEDSAYIRENIPERCPF